MRNYYLYETALQVDSVAELEEGLNNLNEVITNRDTERDNFICNDTIWEYNTTQGRIYELFGGIINSELQRVVPSIFRSFTEKDNVYSTPAEIDCDYPNDCNSFAGIRFNHTAIPIERQVFHGPSYKAFVKRCLKYGTIQTAAEMGENLALIYPSFDFTERAKEECLNWKNQNPGLYDRLFDLFDDIPNNPFTGGIGETEVLRHMKGVASKRINQAHRITYRLEKNRVSILACSGHYD